MELDIARQTITKADLKTWETRIVPVLEFAARWTPTPKDDAAIALIKSIFENQETFDRMCDLLEVTD